MPTAPPPPYQRARDTAPADVGRLQAHFVSHQRFRLLDMHTVIQPGIDRDAIAGAGRLLRAQQRSPVQQGLVSTARWLKHLCPLIRPASSLTRRAGVPIPALHHFALCSSSLNFTSS
jgi:hypothetical protein